MKCFTFSKTFELNKTDSLQYLIVFISFGLDAVTVIAFGALLSGKVQS